MRLVALLLCSVFAFGQNPAPSPQPTPQPPASASDQKSQTQGSLDILSDTKGVDFGPYLKSILKKVRENWYRFIPESAAMKKGKVAIEFAIKPDGSIAGMRLVATSGDAALDRAAWVGISASSPFPALPSEFTGPHLALRFRFYYNPEKGEVPSKSGIAVNISVPPNLQVPVGGTAIVTATVTGTKESALEWTLHGLGCSNDACGKMDGNLYVAPSILPHPPVVYLMAISKVDPTARASITIHILPRSSSQ